jgi:hypothetical protein
MGVVIEIGAKYPGVQLESGGLIYICMYICIYAHM